MQSNYGETDYTTSSFELQNREIKYIGTDEQADGGQSGSNNDFSYNKVHYAPQNTAPITFFGYIHALGLILLEVAGYALPLGFIYFLALYNKLDFSSITLFADVYSILEAPYGVPYLIYEIVLFGLTFIIPIFVVMKLSKVKSSFVFPLRSVKPHILIFGVGVGLGASMIGSRISSLLGDVIYQFSGKTPYTYEYAAPRGTLSTVLFFISLAVMPAIFEELLFRGVILQSLRRFGDGFALIVSSILFGICHGNLVQAPFAIIIGLVMGYFVMYTGSLLPAMLMHFANNFLSGLFLVIITNYPNTSDDILFLISIIRVIFAIVSIVLLKLTEKSFFYIPKSSYPVKEPAKYISYFGKSLLMAAYLVFITISFIANTR